jgi:serine protease inhibitor
MLLLLLQAIVKVDEEGTEAAAVTSVVFGPTAAPGGMMRPLAASGKPADEALQS